MALHNGRIPQGPGSDPNPTGSLSHMRTTAYANDMERGTTTTVGRVRAGMNQLIRGTGILDVNFQGILINHLGFHVYGDNTSEGSYFIRKGDGTLAGQITRSLLKADAAASGSVHILVDNDHELYTLITGGYQQRAGHDIVPDTDNTFYLGDDGTGGPSGAGPKRLWKGVHTRELKFNDGTSMTTTPAGQHTVSLTAGENLTTNHMARIHTDGKAYHAGATLREFVIGRIVTGVSSGAAVTIECVNPVVTLIANSAITAGDYLQTVGVTDGRVETALTTHTHALNGSVTSGSHSHPAGSMTADNESSHTHGVGTYAVPASSLTKSVGLGGHSHTIPASPHGATSTGLPSQIGDVSHPNHTHTMTGSSASGSAHGHSISGTGGSASHGHSDTFAVATAELGQVCGIALASAAGAGNSFSAMLMRL